MSVQRRSALAAVFVACSALGCNSIAQTCEREPEDNPTITYREGAAEGHVYMTSGWQEEMLWFPGGIRYEIRHGLGTAPRWIDSYLSFERYGARTATLAQSAGNQVEIESVDDEQITVRNGSCAEYWLLVVAGTGDDRPSRP